MSSHPVGARWKAVDKDGRIGEIYLSFRNGTLEIWRWERRYSDGSGFVADWGPSYRNCYEQVAGLLTEPFRFERVKDGAK